MGEDRRIQVWRGITTAFASLLALSISVTGAVNGFRTDIDKFLGTKSSRFVTAEGKNARKAYTYRSDYSSTKELLTSVADLGKRMSAEGSVLLKNSGALPLTEKETHQVSLLGFSSYYPVMGGDMGSVVSMNKGTDADTVDLVAALQSRHFAINPTLQHLYQSKKDEFSTEINNFGRKSQVTRITAPLIGERFSSKELSQSQMDQAQPDWRSSLDKDNVMIVTLARASGENRNYTPGKDGVDNKQHLGQRDPLALSDDERQLIDAAVKAKQTNHGKVIILINSVNPMQIQELTDQDGVDAIMQVGLPGAYGFNGVADLLCGRENPSGRLTDTWAVDSANAPAVNNYGDYSWTNADPSHNINSEIVEAEGIYTGYKYYETRYADKVLGRGKADARVGSTSGDAWDYNKEVTYPFGYGLSYTNFRQTLDQVAVDKNDGTVTARIQVTNTGKVPGKDVVQFYVSTPYTDYDRKHHVEKSEVQLLDYGKTNLLQPGQSQTLTIKADVQYMASWDSILGKQGRKGGYLLDAGDYYFALGKDAHQAAENVLKAKGASVNGRMDQVASWNLAERDTSRYAVSKAGVKVTNQLANADLNFYKPGSVTYLSRSNWESTWPKTYKGLTASDSMLMQGLTNQTYQIKPQGDPKKVKFGADNGLTLAQLKGVANIKDKRWSKLMDQLTLPEAMIRTAFGGTSSKPIQSISSPEVVQNDGPNGFASYPLGQYANKDKQSGDPYAVDGTDHNLSYTMGVMAAETVIGQTFSKELAGQWGKALGNYSIWANTSLIWGIGTNLHRTAYNARNHEYYSEDPMLTAYQAASSVSQARKYGCILAPKHFAFNDTEINRTGIAVFMNEQKAREGELRASQSIVEDAGALGMMTGFNRIGVVAVNAHTGLLMNILRKEWGFKGLLSQDFIMDTEYQNLPASAHNGVTMLTSTGNDSLDAVSRKWPEWNLKDVSKDAQLVSDLKRNMTWQNYAYANSNVMDGLDTNSHLETIRTWYDKALMWSTVGTALLTLCSFVMYVVSRRRFYRTV